MIYLKDILKNKKNGIQVIIDNNNKIIGYSENTRNLQENLMNKGFIGTLWRCNLQLNEDNEYVLNFLYEFSDSISNSVQYIEIYQSLSQKNKLKNKLN